MESHAASKFARRSREVGRRDRVLEEGLDTGDHDPGSAATPRREGRHAGRCLVSHQLATLIGQRGSRLQGDDGGRIPQPRRELFGHAVADLGIACDPDEPLAGGALRQRRREVALGAVGHGDEPDVAARPAARSRPNRPGARSGRRRCRSRPGAAAAPTSRAGGGRCRPRPRPRRRAALGNLRRSGPRRSAGRSAPLGRSAPSTGHAGTDGVRELGVDLGNIEIEGFAILAAVEEWRAAKSVATRSAMRRSRPRRPRSGGVGISRRSCRGGSGANRCASAGSRRYPAGRPPRRAPRSESASAGRSSNLLKRFDALLVPSRAQASMASATASSSSFSLADSSGANVDRT